MVLLAPFSQLYHQGLYTIEAIFRQSLKVDLSSTLASVIFKSITNANVLYKMPFTKKSVCRK